MVDEAAATSADDASPPIRVQVSGDKMQVLLTCEGPVAAPAELVAQVEDALAALPFEIPPDKARWEPRLAAWSSQAEPRDVVLLEGTPPVPPRHGRIEWIADFFSAGFVVDDTTDRVNYRKRAAQQSVEKGQLLGRIIAPVEGEDGVDALGRKIAVEKARPARARAGANVRLDEMDGALYAEATGRIRFKDGLVTVDQVVTIEGSVGLETGDIRHPGALVVRGDVEADSVIETKGDIEVMGLMEPASVTTEGSLIVHGGITGADDKRIVVGGGVRAKFIMDAVIEARGSVVVETEIVQASIRARGAVSCGRGRIVGGTITAQGGIEATQTGSEAGVPTQLTAGEDLDLADQLEACDAALADWKRQRDRICERVAPLRQRVDRLDGPVQQALGKLEQQVTQIEEQMASIEAKKRRLRAESRAQCRPQVFIYGRAHAETLLTVGEEKTRFTETVQGPLCVETFEKRLRMRTVNSHERTGHLVKGPGDEKAPSG
jgi:uncharacterized protein